MVCIIKLNIRKKIPITIVTSHKISYPVVMHTTLIAAFNSEALLGEAVGLLREAAYKRSEIRVASRNTLRNLSLNGSAKYKRTARLTDTPAALLRYALVGALIGSLIVEVPVVLWLAISQVESVGMQVVIAVGVWKLGAVVGGLFGLMYGQDHGMDPDVAIEYEGYLKQGAYLVLINVRGERAYKARGILIESGATQVRDLDIPQVETKTPVS